MSIGDEPTTDPGEGNGNDWLEVQERAARFRSAATASREAQVPDLNMAFLASTLEPERPMGQAVATTTADLIASECDAIKEMLLSKNRKYGDSAIKPKRVFSKASAVEQILVRIDDKLSRIESAQNDEDEDVEKDLIGYLVLLRVARRSA